MVVNVARDSQFFVLLSSLFLVILSKLHPAILFLSCFSNTCPCSQSFNCLNELSFNLNKSINPTITVISRVFCTLIHFAISKLPNPYTVGGIGLKCCKVLLTMPVSVNIYIALPKSPEIPSFRPSKLQCNSYRKIIT